MNRFTVSHRRLRIATLCLAATAALLGACKRSDGPGRPVASGRPTATPAASAAPAAYEPPRPAGLSEAEFNVFRHNSEVDPADLAPVLATLIATSQPEPVEECLRRYPDLSRPSKKTETEGQSLLHVAMLRRDLKLVEMVLSAGADANTRDGQGRTVLDIAVASMPEQVALIRKLLLRRGECDIANLYRALELLAAAGQRDAAHLALTRMMNIDGQRDAKGLGLIHFAAIAGSREMIDLLLMHDVSLKITTWEGFTPLHCAVTAKRDPAETVAAILSAEPDVNARDLFDRTPLYVAAAAGAELPVLRELLEAGAKVDLRGDRGYSPLLLAAERGDRENIKLLLSYKADVNQQNAEGKTVLHVAAIRGDLEMAKIMLAAGAGTRYRDNSRMLARVYATNHGHPDISEYILATEAARLKAAGSQPDKAVFPEDEPKRPKKPVTYR